MIDLLFHSTNTLFGTFSTQHLIWLFIPAILSLAMVVGRRHLKSTAVKQALKISLLSLLLAQQVLLYSWYYFTGNFDLKDALPLYPCRISSLLCLFLMFNWREDLFDLLFFMGLPGATIALLLPDTWNLGFPNAMCIQFFAGHSAIVMTIVYLVLIQDYRPSKNSLFRAYKFTAFYLAMLIPINRVLGSNYAYMAQKPDISAVNFLPNGPFHVPFFVGFMFLTYGLLYWIWPNKSNVRQKTRPLVPELNFQDET